MSPEVIESLFVEIINPNGKISIVGTIYRPPNQNIASILEEINKIVSIITKDNKYCYIMRDFNLDLLHYDSHHFTQEFLDSLFSHMLIPLITKPTRVTSHSATLIDNIFTNCFQQNTLNGLILNDISDHFPVFAYFKKDSPTRRESEVIYKRDYAERILLKFQTALSQVNWSSVLIGEDPNDLYNDFVSEYNRHLEDCFPLKIYKPNFYNKPKTPWISKGLLVSVRNKIKLYKKYMTNPTSYRERKYKEYKNKLNNLIRIAKRTYYDTKFEQSKSDLKTTWKLIEVIKIRKKKSSYVPDFFQHK